MIKCLRTTMKIDFFLQVLTFHLPSQHLLEMCLHKIWKNLIECEKIGIFAYERTQKCKLSVFSCSTSLIVQHE
jgi:hypothetical protein